MSGQNGRISDKTPDKAPDKITSRWPLPDNGVRFLLPPFLQKLLSKHPLSRDLYPLAFGYYPHAAGHQIRRGSHPTELLLYCTEGCGHLELEGQQLPVRAGDIVMLPAGVAHAYAADTDNPWSIYWVHYGGEQSAVYSKLLQTSRHIAPAGLSPRIVAEFQSLINRRRVAFTAEAHVHSANRLKALLSDLAEAISSETQAGKLLDLDHLLDVMRRNMDQPLDLDTLAAESNLSKFHFVRRFKALTGHTPIQHFIHLKMQYACHLLDTSDAPLKNIASRVGYDDPYYFSRLFKQCTGMSPQYYRNERQV